MKGMRLNKDEIQLLVDGMEDTLHRLKHDEKVNEDYINYTLKVKSLLKRLEDRLEL